MSRSFRSLGAAAVAAVVTLPVAVFATGETQLAPSQITDSESWERAEEAKKTAYFDAARKADAEALSWAAQEPDSRFAAPGVKADIAARRVTVAAFATGLQPGQIAEFLLITLNSGHEYEAVFQTHATATDIEKALEFAGMKPGLPSAPAKFRFWPRGERVFATASVAGGPSLPLDTFLADASSGIPFPETGFVHCGGIPGEGGTNQVDYLGSGSIVPSYNDPVTIFDVPRLAPQSEVYETVIASTNCTSESWTPVEITFHAEQRPSPLPPTRVRDVSFKLLPGGMVQLDGEDVTPQRAVALLREMSETSRQDPHVSFSWAPECTVGAIGVAAKLLAALESGDAPLRMEPPPAGLPFYRAFLPQEEWRDRSNRYSQPCELRFGQDGAVTLCIISEAWHDDILKPDLSVEEISVDAPQNLPELFATKAADKKDVLLVFAPGETPWATIGPYLEAVRKTHGTVHLFVD